MKNINLYQLVMLLMVTVGIVSCVQDDDFETPNTTVVAPNLEGDVLTIMGINSAFEQLVADAADDLGVDPGDFNYDDVLAQLRESEKLTFETDVITYVEGYVISNDQSGNFFEELILQNAPADPISGIKVLIDVNPLFITYEVGRKVYVRLDGLTAGYDSGVLTLGIIDVNDLGKIGESQMPDYVIRDAVVETIVPKPMLFSEFSDANTNLLVKFADAQFNRNEVLGDDRKTYAGDPSDINFDNENRCDPDTFNCDGPSGGGAEFYSENFEGFDSIEAYVSAGWTNVNVSGGNEVWEIGNFDNNNYAQVSGFSSGEDIIDTWLVTPAIDMDTTIEEELTFNIQTSFDNGTILSVLVSTDFTGDVNAATWNLLDASIPTGPEGGFGSFTPSGPVNVSCVDGMAYIAFRYQGSDPTATTRYHIDDIKITGN